MKNGKQKKLSNAKVNIFYEVATPSYVKDEKLFKKSITEGLGGVSHKNVEVNLIFTSSAKIKQLNKIYLNKNRITDVIAFNYNNPSPLSKAKTYMFSKTLKNTGRRVGGIYKSKKLIKKEKRLPFGDIFVCLPQAKKQSKLFKHPLKKELLILAIHGALHLAGFDDTTLSQRRKMDKLTDKITEKLLSAL